MSWDLTPLLEDYIRAQPNRALGGVRALSGFEYQVRAYLADFARALVDGTSLADEGEVFANAMEALSDHTRRDGAATVCVQVKRTLTRQTLADAAGEFVLVDEFLEQQLRPAERVQIRYECVARSGVRMGQRSLRMKQPLTTRTLLSPRIGAVKHLRFTR